MVYVSMRNTVADYQTSRGVFDANDATRREAGGTGVVQVSRDVNDPNTITMMMEWVDADNARTFLDDPALAERMKAAGVVGAPVVRTISALALRSLRMHRVRD